MSDKKSLDGLLSELKERAKELSCLYQVQETLNNPENSIEDICNSLVQVIPPGWQYPDICKAKIILHSVTYTSNDFLETDWVLSSDIRVQNEVVGCIKVYYTEEMPLLDEGPFLKDERKLINTIAERLGLHLLHLQLKNVFEKLNQADISQKKEWEVIQVVKENAELLMLDWSKKS